MCLPTLGILPSSMTNGNNDLLDESEEKARNYFSYAYEVSFRSNHICTPYSVKQIRKSRTDSTFEFFCATGQHCDNRRYEEMLAFFGIVPLRISAGELVHHYSDGNHHENRHLVYLGVNFNFSFIQ